MKRPIRYILCILAVAVLLSVTLAHADTAQYFYDDLGRLIGVVDG